jgi:hypothetical protein
MTRNDSSHCLGVCVVVRKGQDPMGKRKIPVIVSSQVVQPVA